MNDLIIRLRAWLWWLLPIVLLLVLLGLETDLGRAMYRHPSPQGPIETKPVVVSLLPEYAIDGGTRSHAETVQRTLFNPTRRPAPVAVVEVVKQRMQKGQFALTGTTVAGERSLAFLREVTGGKARTVKLGDTINGMLVADVKPDRVKLALDNETEELVLRVVANPRATPQPASAPAVPGQPPPIPGAPVPGQPPAVPPVTAEAPEVPPGQTLAERRRAARAAEAAARGQAEAAQQVTPSPPVGGAAAQQPAATPAAANTGQPDTGWAAVFQRYQQRKN